VTETNVELARRGYEAALRGDLDAIRALLDADVKWHGGDLSAPGACHNRDQALEFMRQARHRRGVGELVDVVGAGD
jgi:ketosteroid isomerase-like protein